MAGQIQKTEDAVDKLSAFNQAILDTIRVLNLMMSSLLAGNPYTKAEAQMIIDQGALLPTFDQGNVGYVTPGRDLGLSLQELDRGKGYGSGQPTYVTINATGIGDQQIAAVVQNAIQDLNRYGNSTTQPAATGTSTLSKTLQVFGVAHSITPNSWKTQFTTLEPIIDGFIIGSSLYGILGTNVLSY